MREVSYYREYAESAVRKFVDKDENRRYHLVNAVSDLRVERVLDVGCGAGQELLPFVEKKNAFCVGIDVGEELGEVGRAFTSRTDCVGKITYARARGEQLPFPDAVFDVVLCRVALPYMHNKRTIAEVSRVLRTGGVFLLKTHAPRFYFGMLKERAKTLRLKQIAYPIICIAGGSWHTLTGRQPQGGFWDGKEVFQTETFLKREFKEHGMEIINAPSDDNPQTPSFVVVKN